MSSHDFKGIFELKNFLGDYCSANTLSVLDKKLCDILRAEYEHKEAYTPNYTCVFHSKKLTVIVKDDLFNILTEIELIKVGKKFNESYAFHYDTWTAVPKIKHRSVTLAKLKFLLKDLSYYFDQNMLARAEKHAALTEGRTVQCYFNLLLGEDGVVIEKMINDTVFNTTNLKALKGTIIGG